MFKTFESKNCLDAWQQVCLHLIENGKQADNLFIKISQPMEIDDSWLISHNPGKLVPKMTKNNDIRKTINTIFPYRLYELCKQAGYSRHELYKRYLKVHFTSKNQEWGTYFERLISFQGDPEINQLEPIR
jgi:hypothetical protein